MILAGIFGERPVNWRSPCELAANAITKICVRTVSRLTLISLPWSGFRGEGKIRGLCAFCVAYLTRNRERFGARGEAVSESPVVSR